QASQLGTLVGTESFTNLTIATHDNGLPDYDWYHATAGTSGTLTTTLSVTAGGTLEVHLFTLNGNTLVELGSNTASSAGTSTVTGAFAAGSDIYVEVKGQNSSPGVYDQGQYNLTLTLA